MVLVLKLSLAPALVVASTLAARRWGATVGGVLVCLPVVAGPILLLLCLDRGPAFAAEAAAAATTGVLGLAGFAVTVGTVAPRMPAAALPAGWAVVLVGDLALAASRVPALVALALTALALPAADTVLRRAEAVNGPREASVRPDPTDAPHRSGAPSWDLPARAVATAALVLLLTGPVAVAGPTVAGVLAPFPVAISVVCGFTLLRAGRAGAPAVLPLLRGVVRGLVGFAAFCATLALGLTRLPTSASFALATAVALAGALAGLFVGAARSPSGAAVGSGA